MFLTSTNMFTSGPRTEGNSETFRRFRRQLFHSTLAAIMESFRLHMTTPEVVVCPDNHFRRAIYGIGPYIADYQEQVIVAAVVTGWCVRYIYYCSRAITELSY